MEDAMPSSKIALLTPDGPNGKLERREPTMDRLESREVPTQNGYRWIHDAEHGVAVATWDSTPNTSKMLPFFQHELMWVRDGSVTIVEPDGRETTVRAGGCFVFPRGCVRQWKQTEYFRKFAMGFNDASWKEPADPASLRWVLIDPDGALEPASGPAADSLLGPPPIQHERRWFVDPTGQMTVRVWDTTACHCKTGTAEAHEWTHVLAGTVTLIDHARMAHHFNQGDTFVVARGAVHDWQCPGYFRAIHCAFQPKATVVMASAAD
jgi:uncharacterized cupin superfamily protein